MPLEALRGGLLLTLPFLMNEPDAGLLPARKKEDPCIVVDADVTGELNCLVYGSLRWKLVLAQSVFECSDFWALDVGHRMFKRAFSVALGRNTESD